MKRSCKHIDITDWKVVYPWVLDCILRHKSRRDFKDMVRDIGGISLERQKAAIATHDNTIYFDAAVYIAKEACVRIKARRLDLKPITYKDMVDRSSFKTRPIGNECAMQQVFDYIAVHSCAEIWKRRIVPQQISGIRGRGAIYGIRMIQGYILSDNRAIDWTKKHHRRYTPKCKWHVKLDIKECYKSLRVSTFMKLFKRDCANEDIIWLWQELLSSHQTGGYPGFMIGAWTSQWACQYTLSFVYRFAASLKYGAKKVKCVTHAAFQMDDMLFISSNRKALKWAVRKVVKCCKALGFTVKPKWQILNLKEAPIDIVGYRLFRSGGVSIRPRVFIRARRMALRILRTGRIHIKQAKRICAFKGYFKDDGGIRVRNSIKHTDSFKARRRYKLSKIFKGAQRLISMHERSGYGILYTGA